MRLSTLFTTSLPLLASFAAVFVRADTFDSDELVSRYIDSEAVHDIRDYLFDTYDYDARSFGDYADDLLEARAKGSYIVKLKDRSLSDYVDDILEARAKGAPYNVKQKKKVAPAAQKARKDAVRTKVSGNQAKNVAKKKDLQNKAKSEPRYGKPRSAAKQKPNKPGYRAAGRAAGKRLPKQPKTPKPNMKKGDKRSTKSATKQAAANKRTKDRKAAGRNNFADAKAKYKKTTSLPSRKQTFSANGQKVSGKNVRTAVFNSHHFNGNKAPKAGPKQFNNHEQGAAGKKHRPLPKMKGAGQEFPINNKKGGYQGGGDVGTMRAVTQAKKGGGTSFKGVVAHDASRDKSHPGYNDHMQVKAKKNKFKS